MRLCMALAAVVVLLAPGSALGEPADSPDAVSQRFAFMGPKDGPRKFAEWDQLPSRAQVLSLAIPPWSSAEFKCVVASDGALKDCVTVRLDFRSSTTPAEDEARVRALLPSFMLVETDEAGERTEGFVIDIQFHPDQNGDLHPFPQDNTGPNWMRRPTTDERARAYPRAAARAKVDGQTRLNCLIGDDGRLSDCTVIEEAPPGMGFGEAALSLAPDFTVDPTTSPRRVVLPFRWVSAP